MFRRQGIRLSYVMCLYTTIFGGFYVRMIPDTRITHGNARKGDSVYGVKGWLKDLTIRYVDTNRPTLALYYSSFMISLLASSLLCDVLNMFY